MYFIQVSAPACAPSAVISNTALAKMRKEWDSFRVRLSPISPEPCPLSLQHYSCCARHPRNGMLQGLIHF